MSGEDDTFDIDLYGNDDDQQDLYGNGDVAEQQNNTAAPDQTTAGQADAADDEIDFDDPPTDPQPVKTEAVDQPQPTPEAQKQGMKRKAQSDAEEQQEQTPRSQTMTPATQPFDPNATAALKLSELHWWTTEENLRGFCAKAGTEDDLRDIAFGEHKINGKAKGEAYLEFASPGAASKTKSEIERQAKGEGEGVKKIPYQVWFSGLGNPFRNAKDSGGAVGAARKDFNAPQGGAGRGGAYNNFNNRGNFGGRGNFNNRGGGGGYGSNNNFQNRMSGQQQQQGGWGMNNGGNFGNGGYGMGGFGNMQGMYNPAMMMQSMQGMMGRGGFGGGGMGGMGGMKGGGNMMGRGGWGGGGGGNFGQGGGMMGNGGYGGGGGGGGGGFGQGQQNKKPRME